MEPELLKEVIGMIRQANDTMNHLSAEVGGMRADIANLLREQAANAAVRENIRAVETRQQMFEESCKNEFVNIATQSKETKKEIIESLRFWITTSVAIAAASAAFLAILAAHFIK